MKNYTKFLAVVTGAVMTISSMGISFASGTFSDVPSDFWSYKYVANVTENNLMPGYEDGTFKPNESASKLETVVGIYRGLKEVGYVKEDEIGAMVTTHKSAIQNANIPAMLSPYGGEIYSAVAFALEKKIINENDLNGFMKNGKPETINKTDAAIYVGKALNLVVDVKKSIISFSYKDAADIEFRAVEYVDTLIKNGIFSASGDADGNFNPTQLLNRSILATIESGFFDIIEKELVGDSPVIKEEEPVKEVVKPALIQTLEGKITEVYYNNEIVEITTPLGTKKLFSVDEAEMKKEDENISLLNLEKGMEVKVKVQGESIIELDVEKVYPTITGTFDKLSKELVDSKGERYKVATIKLDTGKTGFYKIIEGAYIEIDRIEKGVEALVSGDKVTIGYEEVYAKRIIANSVSSEVLGTIMNTTDFAVGSDVVLKLPDGKIFEQRILEEISVISPDGKPVKMGDIVKTSLSYGKILRIEDTGLVAEDSGVITQILIGKLETKVTIKNREDEERTYIVLLDAKYNVGDKELESGIYGLRLDQDITLSMDGLGVNTILVNRIAEKSKLNMVIDEVISGTTIIMKMTDEEENNWVVTIKDPAVSSLDFKKGDSVKVTGVILSEGIFEAELLIKE